MTTVNDVDRNKQQQRLNRPNDVNCHVTVNTLPSSSSSSSSSDKCHQQSRAYSPTTVKGGVAMTGRITVAVMPILFIFAAATHTTFTSAATVPFDRVDYTLSKAQQLRDSYDAENADVQLEDARSSKLDRLRALLDLLELEYRFQALGERPRKRSPPSYHKWSTLFSASSPAPTARPAAPGDETTDEEERAASYDKRLVSERQINSLLKNTWLG